MDCLDIGIKLDKITSCSSINLFIPFEIEKQHIHDLGGVITGDMELITGIFNEFSTIGKPSSNLVKVTLRNQGNENSIEEPFYIYLINGAENFKFKYPQEGEASSTNIVGTILSIETKHITIPNDNEDIELYLRIRIDLPLKNIEKKILYQHEPKDGKLQSSVKRNQFIDFRLNEKRNLPPTIYKKCTNNFFKINKIHFFLIREFMDDFVMSYPPYSGCRILENDIWLKYFEDKPNLKLNNMLAYHWKAKYDNSSHNDGNSFTLLSKFCFQESSIPKILKFIFITLAIGFVGGMGGNYLTQETFGKKNCIVELTNIPKPKLNSLIKMINIECPFIFKTIK